MMSAFLNKAIFLHPFLFALYSVLFLFANNQKEYRLQVIVIPLLIAIGFAAITLLVCRLIFRSFSLGAPIASLIIFICLSYGRFLEIAHNTKELNSSIIADAGAGALSLAALGIGIAVLIKNKERLRTINKYITLIILALVALTILNIASFEISSGRLFTRSEERSISSSKTINTNAQTPDIYYFIFDRYAGERSLKEQYGFDNSSFLNSLEKKGFYVARDATTNYPKTFLSLASSLNMEYVDFLTKQTNGGASPDESIVTPLIQNNKTIEFLKQRGYTIVNVGSWWEPTKTNKNADYNFSAKYEAYLGADEFTAGFFNTTIASPILKTIFKNPIDVSKDPQNNVHRQAALYEFGIFNEVAQIKSPKFVFTHILLPHDPFVFDKNCNPIPETVVRPNSHQVNYINQIQCTNIMIEKTVDEILKTSSTPPIIILQSDEGPFPMNASVSSEQEWGKASTTALKEKFPILNAYYFPDKETKNLYQTITPVNSFRVLFNTYFEQNFPLLEDKNFVFKDENNYYQFKDVTEQVRSGNTELHPTPTP